MTTAKILGVLSAVAVALTGAILLLGLLPPPAQVDSLALTSLPPPAPVAPANPEASAPLALPVKPPVSERVQPPPSLDGEPRVTVRLTSAAGAPLEGWLLVTPLKRSRGVLAPAKVVRTAIGKEGALSVPGLSTGVHQICAVARKFELQCRVALLMADAGLSLDFRLAPAAAARLTFRDDSGKALPGLRVLPTLSHQQLDFDFAEEIYGATTASDGVADLPSLPPGPMVFTTTLPGKVVFASAPAPLVAGEELALDLVLNTPAALRVTVAPLLSPSGLLALTLVYADGAEVRWAGGRDDVARGATLEVPSGRATLRAETSGNPSLVRKLVLEGGKAQSVLVRNLEGPPTPPKQRSGMCLPGSRDAPLQTWVTLRGRLLHGSRPVESFDLTVSSPYGASELGWQRHTTLPMPVLVGGTGFVVTPVPPDDVLVEVDLPDGRFSSRRLTLTAEPVQDVELPLQEGGRITGRLLLPPRLSYLQHPRILLDGKQCAAPSYASDATVSISMDMEGRFTLGHVAPGHHTLGFTGHEGTVDLEVKVGQETALGELRLPRSPTPAPAAAASSAR